MPAISPGPNGPPAAAAAAWAPRSLRLAAALLDAMLALAASLLLQHAVRAGQLGAFGFWIRSDAGPWLDAQTVVLGLWLLVLRDVPAGTSPGKWLLCLRLARRDGTRLGWRERLLLVPMMGLLPSAWLGRGLQERLPYRVVLHPAARHGLLLRAGLTVAAALLCAAWAVDTVRPSIGRSDARQLAQALVHGDPILRRDLGQPLEYTIVRITPRAREGGRGQHASFQLQVRGPMRQQAMNVHARKVDGRWVVEEIDDIEITRLEAGASEPVARR